MVNKLNIVQGNVGSNQICCLFNKKLSISLIFAYSPSSKYTNVIDALYASPFIQHDIVNQPWQTYQLMG